MARFNHPLYGKINNNIQALPVAVNFNEAKEILGKLHKFAYDDWAFGDSECCWVNDDGDQVACSYIYGGIVEIWFTDNRELNCTYAQMRELNKCYLTITRSQDEVCE